ncbi:MAG TPA: amidophosphoribosyltransferase, partial [Blastocatellia bacterium]|nr:amidophosphoribosyltransferase [Blastocatellia bacterium]
EVHMRISGPPTIAPCYYGVDTPTHEELIAARHSTEEIRRFLDADSLGYLSLRGLLEAVGDPGNTRFCTACYTGQYPTRLGEHGQTMREREEGAALSFATD